MSFFVVEVQCEHCMLVSRSSGGPVSQRRKVVSGRLHFTAAPVSRRRVGFRAVTSALPKMIGPDAFLKYALATGPVILTTPVPDVHSYQYRYHTDTEYLCSSVPILVSILPVLASDHIRTDTGQSGIKTFFTSTDPSSQPRCRYQHTILVPASAPPKFHFIRTSQL